MADAIFDSSGNVNGGNGGRRISAWSGAGQGIANLLAPSTSGISDVPSLLPADSEMGRAMRQTTRYSYPQNINNYDRIVQAANERVAQAQANRAIEELTAKVAALESENQARASGVQTHNVGGPLADNPVIQAYNRGEKLRFW